MLEPREEKSITIHFIANRAVGISSVGSQKLYCIFDFQIFQERQNTELLLLGVPYIAESQTILYLVTSKFNVIGVLNF